MFERFSPDAREAVTSAQAEARRLHHNYIGTEHLLLGLMDQADALSGRLLAEHGLDRPGAEAAILRLLRTADCGPASCTPTHWRRSALTCRPSGKRSRQHSVPERWIVNRPGPGPDA
jgi:ATP-dependent Clp protease ATP-binding subunit ClpA